VPTDRVIAIIARIGDAIARRRPPQSTGAGDVGARRRRDADAPLVS
jgi:hypothetical protein